MQIKKHLAFLMFGLATSFGVASATAPLLITPNGDPHLQIPSGQNNFFFYNVINIDSAPHHIFFNNTYPPGSIINPIRYFGFITPCTSGVLLEGHTSCQLALQIFADAIPGGHITGGPEVCIGSTASVCSQPVPSRVLMVSVLPR